MGPALGIRMFGARETLKRWREDTASQHIQILKPFWSTLFWWQLTLPHPSSAPDPLRFLSCDSALVPASHSPWASPSLSCYFYPLRFSSIFYLSFGCTPKVCFEEYVAIQTDARTPLSSTSSRPPLPVGTPILAKQSIFGGVFSSLVRHPSSPALQFDLRSTESKASFSGAHGFCCLVCWLCLRWGGQVFGLLVWFSWCCSHLCFERSHSQRWPWTPEPPPAFSSQVYVF